MSRASVRRRVAVATWRPSRDGRIHTRAEIDVTAVRAYLDRTRARTGEHVTVTHVVGAAVGRAIAAVPEVRARVVFGRIVPHATCDIGFAVEVPGGDLAPVKVGSVDTLSPAAVARALDDGAARLRAGTDRRHNRSSALVRLAPPWAMRPLLAVAGLLVGGLGVGAFGQPAFPMGAAFVSNVGTLGLDEAFLAPLPFARVPLYVAVGAVRDAPMVIEGRLEVRPRMVVIGTADHRLVDGGHAGRLASLVRELLAAPELLDVPWAECRLNPAR